MVDEYSCKVFLEKPISATFSNDRTYEGMYYPMNKTKSDLELHFSNIRTEIMTYYC